MGIRENIRKIINSSHPDPFSVLGLHMVSDGEGTHVEIRAFLPEASEAWVIDERDSSRHHMENLHRFDFFTVNIPGKKPFPYRLSIRRHDGTEQEFLDPYALSPVLTDFDLHLIGEGTHYRKYEKLGAHVMEVNGVKGVHFGVWAPNARNVSIIGSFNSWDRRRHPMRLLGQSGVWELFVPGIGEGEVYKFFIKSRYHQYESEKSDPYAFYFEFRPKSASVVHDINKYVWQDAPNT